MSPNRTGRVIRQVPAAHGRGIGHDQMASPPENVGVDGSVTASGSASLGYQRWCRSEKWGRGNKEATNGSSVLGPALEPGVFGCFAVVASAVRKGKGRGKVITGNIEGGYVPAHLKDPGDIGREVATKASVECPSDDATSRVETASNVRPDAHVAEPSSRIAGGPDDNTAEKFDTGVSGCFPEPPCSPSAFEAEVVTGTPPKSRGVDVDAQLGEKRAKRWQRRNRPAADESGDARQPPASQIAKPLDDRTVTESIPAAKRQKMSNASAHDDEEPDSGHVNVELTQTTPSVKLPDLSVSKLRSVARIRAVSLVGCIEKADIVETLRRAGVDLVTELMDQDGNPSECPKLTAEQKAQEQVNKQYGEALNDAEKRAAVAEEETRKLRELLNKSVSSSRRKRSEAAVAASMEDQKPGTPLRGYQGADGAKIAPTGGVDMRTIPGLGGDGVGGPGYDICWEFKKGMCNKGPNCHWRHV